MTPDKPDEIAEAIDEFFSNPGEATASNLHITRIVQGDAGFEALCSCGWVSFALPTHKEAAHLASVHKQRIVTLPPDVEALQAAECEINRKLDPTWLRKIEELAPGEACEFHYPARAQWLPGTVVKNGGSGYWSIRDGSDIEGRRGKVSDSLYIEQIRLPGQTEAWA